MSKGDEGFDMDDDLDDILRNARQFESEFHRLEDGLSSEMENRGPRRLDEKEVKVMGVYEHQEQGSPPTAFVLLRDNNDRKVLIWIGRFEAYAISVALEGAMYDRPMTHDLLKSMIDHLKATVERIIIDDLWQDTYYAKITVATVSGNVEIDARPSDAIALALRCNAPIFMAENVIEQAAREI